MNWILALLAFAGLMTILSTIVYIIVEAIHKGLSLRKAGLSEMLRSLHDTVVARLEGNESTFVATERPKIHSKEAIDFAKSLQQSPTYAGSQSWYSPSNWGMNVNQRNFERLSRRQLAEQLAQTEFGQKLANEDRSRIEFALARIGYEFDRFGEAQSAYFKRRAKVLSGIAAFIFVVVANINVIDLYFHLAKDDTALTQTLTSLQASDPDQVSFVTEAMRANAETIRSRLASGELSGQEAVSAAQDMKLFLQELDGGLNLPIGRNYFPYCADPTVDPDKCLMKTFADDGTLTTAQTRLDGFTIFGTIDIPATPTISRLFNHWQTGLYWVFCMIASAGLLALGAPFWFDLFSKAASLIGSVAANRIVGNAPPKESLAEPAMAKPYERTGEPAVKDMADAFMIAAGVPQSRLPPTMSESQPDTGRAEAEPFIDSAPAENTQFRFRMSEDETPVMAKAFVEDDFDPTDALFVYDPIPAPVVVTEPAVATRPIRGVQGNWKGKV